MTDEIEALKARRAELEREIESLESTRVALYMPGVTIVPQEGLPEEDANQQLARLRAAIIEIVATRGLGRRPGILSAARPRVAEIGHLFGLRCCFRPRSQHH